MLIGLAVTPPLQAKNSNYQVCKANATGDGWVCEPSQPGAGAAQAAEPAPASA